MAEPGTGVSVGSYLRSLRQDRQASIEEMARATRVGSYQLEALEADRFTDLPAPVFVKGFIRAYCHFLGIPDDEALRRYRESLGERPPERRAPAPRNQASWRASPLFVSFVLLVLFGGGLLALNLGVKRGGVKPVAPAVAPVAKTEPAPLPTNPTPSAPITPAVATPVEPAQDSTAGQRLLVRAIEATWIRIQTDDLHAVDELLAPGAVREWTAEKRFLLTVGNAGGIEIELNGRPMPPLGQRGAVIRQLQLPQTAAAGS